MVGAGGCWEVGMVGGVGGTQLTMWEGSLPVSLAGIVRCLLASCGVCWLCAGVRVRLVAVTSPSCSYRLPRSLFSEAGCFTSRAREKVPSRAI